MSRNDADLRETVKCCKAAEKDGPGRTCTHARTGSKTPISQPCVAESDALVAQCTSTDPELARLNEKWPDLPGHIRQAILCLLKLNVGVNEGCLLGTYGFDGRA